MKYKKLLFFTITVSVLCSMYYFIPKTSNTAPESLHILYINNANPEELKQVKSSMVAIKAMVQTKLDLPIELEIIEVKNDDEYRVKRNTIMLGNNPPDLILAGRQPLNDLKELNVLLPLEGKIENMNKIYSALKSSHTAAFGFHVKSAVINKKLLASYGIPLPSPDWKDKDAIELVDRLKTLEPGIPIFLTKDLYDCYFNAYLQKILSEKLKGDIDEFTLTDPAFIDALMAMKAQLNKHYDLSSYPSQISRTKMVFEPKSSEYLKQQELIQSRILDSFTVVESVNAMNAVMLTKIYAHTSDLVMLPIGNRIETLRFGISTQAPHQEEALKFLNLALNWDTQFKFALFSDAVKFSQVNTENEERLLAYGEAFASDSNVVEIRKKVLSMLDADFYQDLGEISSEELIVREELMRTTFNIVFDPKLDNRNKVIKELKIAEDRIKLMIKE